MFSLHSSELPLSIGMASGVDFMWEWPIWIWPRICWGLMFDLNIKHRMMSTHLRVNIIEGEQK